MSSGLSKAAANDWWRDFFEPLLGEVMFASRIASSNAEVDQIIRRARIRPPAAVLDLACGIGRHSVCFAARGMRVTGLDYSKPFLAQAQKTARAARQKITFVRGDMRKVSAHFAPNSFDLAVCVFTSFGYFARRSDDQKVLRSVYRVLRPGGAFVVNTVNRSAAIKRLRSPVSLGSEPLPNVFMIDQVRYDRKTKQTVTTWTIIDTRRPKTRVVRKSFRVNVYSHTELKRLLIASGFKVESVWGMLPGGRFDPKTTWHQTILARKPPARRRVNSRVQASSSRRSPP
jgi:ubiquinone/menaquinone biosynthesis C-methylase UbiE